MRTTDRIASFVVCLGLLNLGSLARADVPAPSQSTTNCFQLNGWSFAGTNWESDAGYPPVAFTNIVAVPGGNGAALLVDSTNPAFLCFNVTEADGTTNLTLGAGSILCFFAPNWSSTNAGGTGPGDWASLVQVGQCTTNASYGYWCLCIDPPGQHLCFLAQANNGSQATYLTAPIAWTNGDWHQVALTYSSTNSALYVDGALVTNGLPVTVLPPPGVVARGLWLGSATNGLEQMRGALADLTTWNYPLDGGTIAGFWLLSSIFFPGSTAPRMNLVQAPFQPGTNALSAWCAVTGPGFLTNSWPLSGCSNVGPLLITNVTAQAGPSNTMNITFSIVGTNSGPLDVFGTTHLAGGDITNSGPWYWLGQGYTCMTYSLTLTDSVVFLVLGTSQDSDMDGLTDAYELLVSRTDPNNPYSYDTGLLDGWYVAYHLASSVDPYAQCPSGDGWSILQACQNGWNPNDYHTPPAPSGLSASYNPAAAWVSLTWNPSPGPVTGYTLQRYIPELGQTWTTNLPASASSFLDSPFPLASLNPIYQPPTYQIVAKYGAVDSAWSQQVPVYWVQSGLPFFMRGPSSSSYLAIPALPPGTTNIQLFRVQGDSYSGYSITNWTLPMALLTNGICSLPDSWGPQKAYDSPCSWYLRTTNSHGIATATVFAWAEYYRSIPFFDARQQLKDNLAFVLRTADASGPSAFSVTADGFCWSDFGCPSAYAFSGFYYLQPEDYFQLFPQYEFGPFGYNNLYRNWVFTLADVDASGNFATGAYADVLYGPALLYPPKYLFQAPTAPTNIPSLLAPGVARWACLGPTDSEYFLDTDGTNSWLSIPNWTNIYGLPCVTGALCWGSNPADTLTLYAGQTTPPTNAIAGLIYWEIAQPRLQTVDYYFTSLADNLPIYGGTARTPLPGQPGFSVTDTTPVLIAPAGAPFKVVGYAKQAIANGAPGVYAYLAQYFDKAYRANPDGTVSTSQTGILSEYGEFTPTEPGLVFLATMPDLTQTNNLQGYCPVNVIKLQLDVNHDGIMDLSFNGPDNTTWDQPYSLWCNNNFDRWATNKVAGGLVYTDVEQDDQVTGTCPATPSTATPDCNYRDQYGNRIIPCTRDLEDFARLWVCGVTSNLLSALPAGSTITLNWGDVGSPNPANPTIDLFLAADADGGIGYQTNETVAAQQTNALVGRFIQRLRPGQSILLNSSQYSNNWAGNYFIWCGVSNGTGGLNLTIADGNGNTLAQTTSYIQITDIKQMYERWTVGDTAGPWPADLAIPAEEMPAPGMLPFQYGPPASPNTPYILHVHGFNMALWEKDRYAETEFKRLYWQGYQGRFGSFRWPTTLQGLNLLLAFDQSEIEAWSSAVGLANLLTSLNQEYPGNVFLTAHSHGGVVAGEALRLVGRNMVVNTYVAMQAALDSHAYDPTTPARQVQYPAKLFTPDRYTQYWTNGAPCYFNGVAGAGTCVNFFNTNDWALNQTWTRDQNTKPDTAAGYSYLPDTDTWSQPLPNGGTVPAIFPRDTYVIYSFCDQAHSFAIGMQPGVGGIFRGNQAELDIAPYGFLSQHIYHSAEFRSDNPQRWQFWSRVLIKMGLKEE